MLVHHDTRPYEIAAAEAGEYARTRLEAMVEKGKSLALELVEKLESEVPRDALVKANALTFELTPDQYIIRANDTEWSLHDNAWNQMTTKLGFPKRYADHLLGRDTPPDNEYDESDTWNKDLLAYNINTLLHHNDNRYLIRSVANEARGFLSDRYKILDMRPIFNDVMVVADELGCVPIDAHPLDLKSEIKLALPNIFSFIPNEPMIIYIQLRSSDYGLGKVEANFGFMRCWCTNLAIGDTLYGQVHLGKTLPEGIDFSHETINLNTRTVRSAIKDVVRTAFGDNNIQRLAAAVTKANNEKAPRDIPNYLKGLGMSKDEIEKTKLVLDTTNVTILPPGDTMWRVSNSISWLAGNTKNGLRRLELQDLAGKVIGGKHDDSLDIAA